MNEVVSLIDGQAVTTSLAISEGTEVEHKAVIQLVRTYIEDLQEFGLVTFEMRPRLAGTHGGGDVEYAILNEDQSTLVITFMRNTQIVRNFKKRLVKEFRRLRDNQPKLPSTYLEALQALVQAEIAKDAIEQEKKALEAETAAQKAKLEIDTPKAEALDRLSSGEGSLCFTNGAKALKMRPMELIKRLSEKAWIFKRPGGKIWIGYQDKINAGYLEHKITKVERPDGSVKVVEQCLITPKGMAKLASIFNCQLEEGVV